MERAQADQALDNVYTMLTFETLQNLERLLVERLSFGKVFFLYIHSPAVFTILEKRIVTSFS